MEKKRKRLFISKKTSAGEREKLIKLAVGNECNTIVFSLDDPFFTTRNRKQRYIKLIKSYPIHIEAGGHDLHLLMPKNLFMFNRDLFRMEQGKRIKKHHFCPTNPKTISIIADRANALFARAFMEVTTPRIFHLLPEKDHENTWCQCPACRAFRPAEQYMIAVNAAADVLAKFDPEAKIIYNDFDPEPEAARVKPRGNTISLPKN
jgi:hypothetical protein